MSKKNKHKYQYAAAVAPVSSEVMAASEHEHAAEYRFVRNDLIRLLIVNLVFLAAMLALYFTNQKSHYLEQWFSRIHF